MTGKLIGIVRATGLKSPPDVLDAVTIGAQDVVTVRFREGNVAHDPTRYSTGRVGHIGLMLDGTGIPHRAGDRIAIAGALLEVGTPLLRVTPKPGHPVPPPAWHAGVSAQVIRGGAIAVGEPASMIYTGAAPD